MNKITEKYTYVDATNEAESNLSDELRAKKDELRESAN